MAIRFHGEWASRSNHRSTSRRGRFTRSTAVVALIAAASLSSASVAFGVPAAQDPVKVLKPLMLTAQEAQAATGIAVSNAEVKCYKVTGVNQCTVSLRPPSAPTFPAFVNIASFPTTAEAEQAVRSVAKTDSGDVKYTVLRRSPSAVTFVTTMPYGESVNVIRQVGNRLIHGSCDKPKDEPNAKARACATALAAAQVTKAK